jgi:hypothetical protein
MNMPLDRARRPGRRERGLHRRPVGDQAVGERLERGEAARTGVGEPGVEPGRIALGDQPAEALEEAVPGRQVGVLGQQARQRVGFVGVEGLGWPQAQPADVEPTPVARRPSRRPRPRRAPVVDRLPDQRGAAPVALGDDLADELADVAGAGLPSIPKVFGEGSELWGTDMGPQWRVTIVTITL